MASLYREGKDGRRAVVNESPTFEGVFNVTTFGYNQHHKKWGLIQRKGLFGKEKALAKAKGWVNEQTYI